MPQRFKSHRDLISASTRCSRPTARSGSASAWSSTANRRACRSARRRVAILVPLFIAVIVVYNNYESWFAPSEPTASGWMTPIQIVTVLALLALGWAIARDIGRVAGPTFFRRMDPGTAGTVGFLVRLVTVGITLLVALEIAGVSAASLVATKRVHRRDPRSRRAADARQPVRRNGAAQRAPVPGRRARPVPGRRRRRDRSKGSSARSACSTRRWPRARTGSWCRTTSCCRPWWSRSGSPTRST